MNGSADGYPCEQVGLLSHMPLDAFDLGFALKIWGFYDLNTEREYALIAFREGISVVDVTDPTSPREIGTILGDTAAFRDIRTYQFFDETENRWRAFAYVTSHEGILVGSVGAENEGDADVLRARSLPAPRNRLMVIDLSDLPGSISLAAQATDDVTALSVNLANVDDETNVALPGVEPLLFVSGSGNTDGRFRAYELSDPLAPTLISESPSPGSTNVGSAIISDARMEQCPNRTTHCVISIDFASDRMDLWDATDASDFRLLSSTRYSLSSVFSGGWMSEDKQFLFLNEGGLGLQIFSLADLAAPVPAGQWARELPDRESRGLGRGNRYYMGTWKPGLRVLDISDPLRPEEVGFFDIVSNRDFNLVVGVHIFLPSGTILLGEYNAGLFALTDQSLLPAQGQLRFAGNTAAGVEGNAVSLSVTRIGAAAGDVAVSYEAFSGSADSDDFNPTAGTLTWTAGDSEDRTIEIELVADALDEGVERFFVRLFDPDNGASLGVPRLTSVFVNDVGAVSEIEFDRASVSGREGSGGVALVPVRRVGSALGEVSVTYRTLQGSASEGEDYVGVASGTLVWADRDARSQVIEVPLVDDGVSEAIERFQVELLSVDGGLLRANATIDVEIQNPLPIAVAGNSRSVAPGASVSLDGGESLDPEDETLAYAWSQEAGTPVLLTGANKATATFTAPWVRVQSRLEFYLTVTDPAGNMATDRMTITLAPGLSDGGGSGSIGWLTLVAVLIAWSVRQRSECVTGSRCRWGKTKSLNLARLIQALANVGVIAVAREAI